MAAAVRLLSAEVWGQRKENERLLARIGAQWESDKWNNFSSVNKTPQKGQDVAADC